ncbi:MAG TPA: hypothetical protein VGJ91_18000, partial [Polyangiaceae bacterium]
SSGIRALDWANTQEFSQPGRLSWRARPRQLAREVQRSGGSGAMIRHMEGPLFVIKSWALAALGLWLYRRFFERVAKSVPEFEAWSRSAPLLAALHGDDAALEAIEEALRARLGKRACLVATLGGWPWPNYALSIRLARAAGVLELRVTRAELLRTHGAPPPSLIATLRDVLNEHPGAIDDTWLCPGTFYGKHGPDQARSGWLLEPGNEPRPRLVARAASPVWLPKLLALSSEC